MGLIKSVWIKFSIYFRVQGIQRSRVLENKSPEEQGSGESEIE